MLAIAYASVQKQEIKIHQPEVCYQAAGFKIVRINEHEFKLGNHAYSIKGKQVLFRKANRLEALSYWIRIGEAFPQSGMAMRLKILYEGLKGKIDDGVLVRVSTIIDDESQALEAYQLQGKFLAEFVKVTAMVAPSLLVP
jgi:EpsI family protein